MTYNNSNSFFLFNVTIRDYLHIFSVLGCQIKCAMRENVICKRENKFLDRLWEISLRFSTFRLGRSTVISYFTALRRSSGRGVHNQLVTSVPHQFGSKGHQIVTLVLRASKIKHFGYFRQMFEVRVRLNKQVLQTELLVFDAVENILLGWRKKPVWTLCLS